MPGCFDSFGRSCGCVVGIGIGVIILIIIAVVLTGNCTIG